MDAFLVVDAQEFSEESKPVRAQAVAMLSKLLTQEDRQIIATVAAEVMSQGIFQIDQQQKQTLA